MNRMRTRRALLILTPATLLACVAAWRFMASGRPFDATAWRNDADVVSRARQEMADDLLRRRTLIGLTRTEVIGLLGEPPNTEYFQSYDLVYWLGPERGFMAIDSEWLVIRFAEGRVMEARIVTD